MPLFVSGKMLLCSHLNFQEHEIVPDTFTFFSIISSNHIGSWYHQVTGYAILSKNHLSHSYPPLGLILSPLTSVEYCSISRHWRQFHLLKDHLWGRQTPGIQAFKTKKPSTKAKKTCSSAFLYTSCPVYFTCFVLWALMLVINTEDTQQWTQAALCCQ